MRDNGPVTGREIDYPAESMIVSRTDSKGCITFVNKAFIDISGYTEDELMGAPHNILRHPDMPKEAFADLWQTIQKGRSWDGIVKNRSKNGDHYWVQANVTPIIENSEIIGYLSIRSKPGRKQTDQAEALYAKIRQGKAGSIRVIEGSAINTGLKSRIARASHGIRVRLNTSFSILAVIFLLVGMSCLLGMYRSMNAVEFVYQDGAVMVGQISGINDLIRENAYLVAVMQAEMASGVSIEKRTDRISHNTGSIKEKLDTLKSWLKTDEEKESVDALIQANTTFVSEVTDPALAAASKSDADGLRQIVVTKLVKGFNPVKAACADMISIELRNAGATYEETKSGFGKLKKTVPASIVFFLIIMGAALVLIRKSLMRPLKRIASYFVAISKGDLASDIQAEPVSEFQPSVAMLRSMRAKLAYGIQEKTETDRRVTERIHDNMNKVADDLDAQIKGVISAIAAVSEKLSTSATTMSSNAGNAVRQSANVQSETNRVVNNISSVSSSTHELTASVNEISRQVASAANIAQAAVDQAASTNATMQSLSDAAANINKVVDLIKSIADQTNLLALNATIEAARAGEAGKGFAVVASEVKALANQTSKATEEISHKIGEMQTQTQGAVSAINDISKTIKTIDELSTGIAAAVEEQGAATSEIARNIDQAVSGTTSMSTSMDIVAQAATDTESTSQEVSLAAASLKQEAENLNREIKSFVAKIRG